MSENNSPPPTPAEDDLDRRATAYHEAGHAVMSLTVGRAIQKVTIARGRLPAGGQRLGACEIKKARFKPSNDELEDDVLILLAGMVAVIEPEAVAIVSPITTGEPKLPLASDSCAVKWFGRMKKPPTLYTPAASYGTLTVAPGHNDAAKG